MNSLATKKQLPVIIIGAGPVGMSLALACGRANIPAVVIEKDNAFIEEIRASTLHPPTLEMMEEWGVLDSLLAVGSKVDEITYWERENHTKIASFNYAAIRNDTAHPYRLHCPQHILLNQLRLVVDRFPSVDVRMRHQFLGFVEKDDQITASILNQDGEFEMHGSLICGTDGAASSVRQAMRMPFRGKTYPDRFLMIGTDFDFDTIFPHFGAVNYIFDPDEWVIILRLPSITRVVFRLKDHEDQTLVQQDDQIKERMWRFFGEKIAFNILSVQQYRTYQRIADSFSDGRAVILGDAAHINNPAGGMGMNSGIHDAYALAQALAPEWPTVSLPNLQLWSTQRRLFAC